MIVQSRRREPLVVRLFGWLRRRPTPPSACLDETAFRQQIAKERVRADRRNIEFSLLQLVSVDGALNPTRTASLVRQFKMRLRITDEIGMLGRDLAVLLVDTPGDGACKVAGDLCELAMAEGVQIHPRVYVYPDDFTHRRPPDSSWPVHAPLDDLPGHQGKTRSASGENIVAMVRPEPLRFYQPTPYRKRLFDLAAAILGLVTFSPLMLAAAALIKLNSPGPALFVQWREGKDGKKFKIYKFRTMVIGAEEQQEELMRANEQDGPAFKIADDPRLTPIGRLLRKSCIDELPQLFNVIRGDMSLVGPRPLPVHESVQCTRWQRRRLDVLPGMTCIWQVSGRRPMQFAEWMRLDLDYSRRRSLRFDIWLLVKTVQVAVLHRGSV